MKSTIAAIAITLALVVPAFAQAIKLGDAYGVAAIRFVNAWSSDQSAAWPTLSELEAQISSDAEQASYDGIVKIVKADRAANFAINSKPGATMADINAYYATRQPCYDALKTNLKHRDGTIPAECK